MVIFLVVFSYHKPPGITVSVDCRCSPISGFWLFHEVCIRLKIPAVPQQQALLCPVLRNIVRERKPSGCPTFGFPSLRPPPSSIHAPPVLPLPTPNSEMAGTPPGQRSTSAIIIISPTPFVSFDVALRCRRLHPLARAGISGGLHKDHRADAPSRSRRRVALRSPREAALATGYGCGERGRTHRARASGGWRTSWESG